MVIGIECYELFARSYVWSYIFICGKGFLFYNNRL